MSNNTSNSLANPSLSWMVNEVILADIGILFRRDAFEGIPGVAAVVTPKLSIQKPVGSLVKDTGSSPNSEGATTLANILTDSPIPASDTSLHRPSPVEPHKKRAEAPLTDDATLVGVRQENMVRDAVAPMYDKLKARPVWWLLEYLPMLDYKQDSKGHWHRGLQ